MLVEEGQNMLRSSPFLLFDGNCAEAMTFYQACLGGELTLTKLGDTPMKESFAPEKHERIINAHLKSGSIELSATDWMAAPAYEPRYGDIFAIFVLGDGYDELKAVFDKLSEGAQADRFQDLHDLPFGTYGQFFDKYGYQWIFKGDKRE
jgi:PhnB protein